MQKIALEILPLITREI